MRLRALPSKMVIERRAGDGMSDKTVLMTTEACGVRVSSCYPERHHSVDGNSYPGKQWSIRDSSNVSRQV